MSKHKFFGLIFMYLIILVLSNIIFVFASEINFRPDATNGTDTRIIQESGESNHGSSTILSIGADGGGERRTLMNWNFSCATIPDGSVINNVTLELVADSPLSPIIAIRPIIDSWSESVVTWNNQPSTNASWNVLLKNVSDGGSRLNLTINKTYYQKLCNNVLGSGDNDGLMFFSDNDPSKNTDYFSSDHATPTNRPKLYITFTEGGGAASETLNISAIKDLIIGGTQFNTTFLNLNITMNSSLKTNCSLFINNTLNITRGNYSLGVNQFVGFNLTFPIIAEETHTAIIGCNDNVSRVNTSEVLFTVDNVAPQISFQSCNSCFSGNKSLDQTPTINVTVTDFTSVNMVRISNISQGFDGMGGTNNCTPGIGNWICTLPENNKLSFGSQKNVYFTASDIAKNKNGVPNMTLTLTLEPNFESLNTSLIYDAAVTESSIQTFFLLINESGFDVTNAIFTFNNTLYETTVSLSDIEVNLTSTILIPNTGFNITDRGSFFWSYNLSGTLFNTTRFYQNFSRITITDCKNLSIPALESIHTKLFDEETLEPITSDFDIFFKINKAPFREYTFNFTGNNSYKKCIFPQGEKFNVTAQAEYEAPGFVKKNYWFNNYTLSNISRNLNLYLISTGNSTSISYKVKDELGRNLPDVILVFQRFFPGTNSYIEVERVKTDWDGNALAHLVAFKVPYRILAVRNGQVIQTFSPSYITLSSYTLRLQIGSDPLKIFDVIDNVAFSLTFNNETNFFSLTFIDQDNFFQTACLKVIKREAKGDIEICDNCVEASSATITCFAGNNISGQYIATAYIDTGKENTIFLLDILSVLKTQIKNVFGFQGPLLAALLIITGATVFTFSPAVSIFMTVISIVSLSLFGFLSLGWAAAVTIVLIGIGLMFQTKT